MEAQRPWHHEHRFHEPSASAEKGTRAVMWITAAAMVLEIAAGWWFGSMALLADGWHMSSHALAIGLSAFAYAASRRYAADRRFAFGTWKIEVLAGFASAVMLLCVAALMALGSIERLFSPQPIQYREALLVAVLGLGVNIVCAVILGDAHSHGRGSDHGHGHTHQHGHGHDLNLRSAYLHVIADAATSALAIVALAGGWLWGWSWLDPAMGLVGSALVALWAKGLLHQTGAALLDREMDHDVVREIQEEIERTGSERVQDLHVWRVGKDAYACAITVVASDSGFDASQARRRLAVHEEVVHATIEVHHVAAGDD